MSAACPSPGPAGDASSGNAICTRRGWLARTAAGTAAITALNGLTAPEAQATPEALEAALRRFANGAAIQSGRVTLTLAELVENGNTVPITVRVESPMTAEQHVRRIGLFAERNPLPEMAVFHLGPRSGRPEVATRVRLSTAQRVVAVAELSDGRYWQGQAEVVVTLAACIEGS
jgi:sulfur-oxidizing protein SoxY